jgi:hypothetical protein
VLPPQSTHPVWFTQKQVPPKSRSGNYALFSLII